MSGISRPVCWPCRREMSCAKNGQFVERYEGAGGVYSGDRYECSCGASVVVGFSQKAWRPTVLPEDRIVLK